jgi:hypothetical protein
MTTTGMRVFLAFAYYCARETIGRLWALWRHCHEDTGVGVGGAYSDDARAGVISKHLL